jgi:hypothetical protein
MKQGAGRRIKQRNTSRSIPNTLVTGSDFLHLILCIMGGELNEGTEN